MNDALAVEATDVTKTFGRATRLSASPHRSSLKEESTATLSVPQPVPAGTQEVTFEVTPDARVGPTSPVSLPVQ
ncbi:MAG TPA: hypothetical protein VFI99_12815 [Nocardioides sp.]|nr:hypothetical protein [Nocardioides sp.]